LNRWQLILLTVTAFVSGWNPADTWWQRAVALAVFLLMLGALALTGWLQQGDYDSKWFDCRAAAETIKSASWYFVMATHADAVAKKTYEDEVAQIFQRLPDVQEHLLETETGSISTAVTPEMVNTRAMSVAERAAIYRAERAENQLHWYSKKSAWNGTRATYWRVGVLICEFGAAGYAVVQLLTLWPMNLVGGIAALSAAAIAWLQTKRFSDLKKTYAVAARDLQQILDKFQSVTTEDGLMDFVTSVESAVSREHSIWLKRRMS
jgi:hypothetical protein